MLIQAYDPQWVLNFQKIKSILQEKLTGQLITIEHIGSTAVPGLAAKPIIDIDMVYESDAQFAEIVSRLSTLGYYHNGNQGIPKREAFKRKISSEHHPVLDQIQHHLYACPVDSEELQRHLTFRDYLRANEWARDAYVAIKQEIAAASGQDHKAYAELKEVRARDFVLSILER